jgi:hypothetical protein
MSRPAHGEDAGAALWRLIDRADAAMYEAKQAARDRVAATCAPFARTAASGTAAIRSAPLAGTVT